MSGLLKCGRCGGNMVKGGPSYRCYRRINLGKSTCQGMSVLVNAADDAITHAFISRVSTLPDDDGLLVDLAIRWLAVEDPEKDVRRTELTLAVDDARARLDSLDEAHFVQGRFKGPKGQQRYDQLRDAITAQLDSLEAELAELTRAIDITILRDGEMLHQAWMAADQERARMLLRVVLHSVALLPSRGQGCKDPVLTRFRFHWVGEDPQPVGTVPQGR
nr:zinc ribbon domain-containing protein [Streptomyces globosus]